MTRREELLEQYEDALFTLLMDDFAASEGAKALEENERLKREAEIVPLPVQQRCVKFINRYYNKQNLRVMGRTAHRILGKVAMVTLVAVVSFSTAFAASPEFRTRALNLAIEMFDDHTQISFKSEDEEVESFKEKTLVTNWLPDDWTLVEDHSDSSRSKWIVFETTAGKAEVSVFNSATMISNYDTEDAAVRWIEIQGLDAMLIEKDNAIQMVWVDTEKVLLWDIYAENETLDDLLRVAENLELK